MRVALMPEEERRRLRKEAARRAKQERKDAEQAQVGGGAGWPPFVTGVANLNSVTHTHT